VRGKRLAHFELLAPIGVGGMAAVIRARDTQLDRIVALKILPPQQARDPESVRRFNQEARAAARLDHENIARVFYCGEDQGLHFIAFEFVEGENLRGLLDRRGRLPVPEALHYLLQVATGLAHAAARGVVHRDIKPSNIIIPPSPRGPLALPAAPPPRRVATPRALPPPPPDAPRAPPPPPPPAQLPPVVPAPPPARPGPPPGPARTPPKNDRATPPRNPSPRE